MTSPTGVTITQGGAASAPPGAAPVDLAPALYGHDPLPRIVAVEPAGGTAVLVYRRGEEGAVAVEREPLHPWLLMREEDRGLLPPGEVEVTPLAGPSPLDRLVTFPRWQAASAAQAALQASNAPVFWFRSPVAQYLAITGRTLFGGMRFEDLHRLQLDAETASLRAHSPDAGVLLVALTDSRGFEEVLSARDGGEAELLRRVTARIAELDPDVIEGHNLADFDLPYLAARADRLGVSLNWGRDGSRVWLQEREGRFKVGGRIMPSNRVRVHGRHVVDTYQQIQRFDSGGNLESYALKAVMDDLDLVREEREFVDRTDIVGLWEREPERLARYCLDDARDVRDLADLVTPTEFYQTQIVPRPYQDVATGGTGEKVNALMVRAYVAARASVPVPEAPRPYPGGYLELRRAGVFRHVVKCDVESLYPAVMLHYGYKPKADVLGVFLPLLRDLTERRLEAKHRIRTSSGADKAYWTGLSSSFKVLINSMYGYLGYERASFNDFAAAEQVTTTGQVLIKEVLAELERRGCEIIEVDTDGVYFVAPPEVDTEAQEAALIEDVGRVLPSAIHLAHDGRYAGMIALKQKTYFLLTYEDKLIARGSSLRSRRDERFLREFGKQAAVTLIRGSLEDVAAEYHVLAERIQQGQLPVADFARRESITGKTFSSPGLKRLAAAAQGTAVGQRVEVYQRRDGSLAQTSEYADDEDRDYLLRRLHDMARRYEVLAPTKDDFKRLFPKLTARRVPEENGAVQLALFA